MTRKISFTKYENRILPGFRERISSAESTEDVRKFFAYATMELFESVFEGRVDCRFDDIVFKHDWDPPYTLDERVCSSEEFNSAWSDSDLSRVIGRLAESAAKRCRHLEKHPEKTDSKIRK